MDWAFSLLVLNFLVGLYLCSLNIALHQHISTN
jgi:hypothetical protein